ncbi:GntR family transcriptional regulator [Streptomyces sp. NPDC059491]|uniref:GntR family transcriptional regulator n=1 Tax=Streptomyces sp. NPDC059491 TaxID=3346850 RepID=UPI00368BA3F7
MAQSTGYAQIADHFRKRIQDGELPPGATMPSMREVAEQFQVAQTTVNRAFRVLKGEGLTLPKAGVGTVVAGPSSTSIATRVALHASTGSAMAQGEVSRILEVGTVGADELVAPRLEVPPGTPVHVRRRVVSRGGVPVHLSSSFYPAYVMAVTPELAEPVSTGASRELAAERLGVAQAHLLEEITSRIATEAEKSALGLTIDPAPVTQVIRTVRLADERVVEVAVKVVGGATPLLYPASLR